MIERLKQDLDEEAIKNFDQFYNELTIVQQKTEERKSIEKVKV